MTSTQPKLTRTEKRRRKRISLANKGRYHGRSKLKEEQVWEIRSALKRKHNVATLAAQYGVSSRSINRIKYGHTFRYLKVEKKSE